MLNFFKWVFTAIFATLAWIVTGYTVEYFKPYKKRLNRLKQAGGKWRRCFRAWIKGNHAASRGTRDVLFKKQTPPHV